MKQNPFFIELSSNANSYSHVNTVANFKNSIMIDPLEGDWEMAMVEVSYMKTWKNLVNSVDICLKINRNGLVKREIPKRSSDETVKRKRAPFIMTPLTGAAVSPITATVSGLAQKKPVPKPTKPVQPVSTPVKTIPPKIKKEKIFACQTLEAGHYESINALINELNKKLKAVSDDTNLMKSEPHLIYDDNTKFVTLVSGVDKINRFVYPILNPTICEILGLLNYNPDNDSIRELNGSRPVELNAGLHTLYFYCDIIEPQFIADTRARLLRTVEIPDEAKFGSTINIKYDNPHYVPIIVNDFEYIEIDIKDDTNERIPFLYGRTRVKLHLRRRYVE